MVKQIRYGLLSCWFIWLAAAAWAQNGEEAAREKEIPGSFLFAEFYPAVILFKSGETAEKRLNYDVIKEEMVYVQDGKLHVLGLAGIDTVYLGGKKLVPFNRTFCELLSVPGGILYIRHRYNIRNNQNPAGYGGYTQTSNTASIRGTNMLGEFHELDARTKYEVEATPVLWIRREGRFYNANNLRQLQKAFPDKKRTLKQLAKERKTDFTKPNEVTELLKLLD